MLRLPSLRRLLLLANLLALALVLLAHRSDVQARLYGIGDGLEALVGRPAPRLDVPLLDGDRLHGTVRLDDLRGRVALIHFWTFG